MDSELASHAAKIRASVLTREQCARYGISTDWRPVGEHLEVRYIHMDSGRTATVRLTENRMIRWLIMRSEDAGPAAIAVRPGMIREFTKAFLLEGKLPYAVGRLV